MGVMASSTMYLPSEVLQYRNYPEVNYALNDINTILDYAMRVNNAITDYVTGVFDKVDVDAHDLQVHIDLCRSVCYTLGTAPNVCYDLLMELRSIQSVMQTVMYTKNRYGDTYVGTPTLTTTT